MGRSARSSQPPRRKRFGQHFLHERGAIERIFAALAPQRGDHLVEIGPGRGALTARLLGLTDCTLDAIEVDRDLAASLAGSFGDSPRHALHVGDALEFDFTRLAAERGGRLRIVGNLPYNISTPLLFRLLAHAAALVDAHVMLQREVVLRLAAPPGSGDYGRLSVMLSPWMSSERLFDLGPGAFQPPPRVWSAVARLTVRPAPLFAVSPHYAAVVRTAFSHRRKTLRNALAGLLGRDTILSCGLDPGARPETLTPEQFNTLALTLDRARI
ncbi:MAG TPA: 16S rRNA (adenine(1518)-N(6)/adenine(1519)-N(6))-dimethyltransferase RsmA [Steroidobacteraceae bacterium]|jgi:16S rRNA (adenine1518-N6/adenine1519-N6)-dimethyltransferase|nr:16S rRNA (adenine(1518)-N(6)/adenine(1519)-N(6))-dimethyltransferase RsmA [Steroidobacteraceae bacterium]